MSSGDVPDFKKKEEKKEKVLPFKESTRLTNATFLVLDPKKKMSPDNVKVGFNLLKWYLVLTKRGFQK